MPVSITDLMLYVSSHIIMTLINIDLTNRKEEQRVKVVLAHPELYPLCQYQISHFSFSSHLLHSDPRLCWPIHASLDMGHEHPDLGTKKTESAIYN